MISFQQVFEAAGLDWPATTARWLLLAGAGGVALLTIYILYSLFIAPHFSGLYQLPGPPSTSLLFGNMRDILTIGQAETQFLWGDEYGPTYRNHRLIGGLQAYTTDFTAIKHILQHPDMFIKGKGGNLILSDVLGKGLVTVEGHTHRRQRRVLNPAFGWVQVQAMTPMIFEKAITLRRRMQRLVEDGPQPGAREMEMIQQLSDVSLDIIGAVGFDHDLGALDDKPNSLRAAYTHGQAEGLKMSLLALLHMELPISRYFTPNPRGKVLKASRATASVLVADRKRQLASHGSSVEKDTPGKDVLTLLMKANMAPDLREDQRLDDLEVVDQIATLLFAGHETTATALTWCLYLLALHPDVQDRLREEVQGVYEEDPDHDTLNGLRYLDNVVRETLRLEPPVPFSARVATERTVVPLETPIRGRNGKLITELHVAKDEQIAIPIAYINQMSSIWGPDAREFNPDRFDSDEKRPNVPGVWGNIMTFLGGPHNCIGHRLTITEMKVILFVLIRAFAFELPPSRPEIGRTWLVIQRTIIKGQEDKGPQMPLLVRAV